MIKLLLSLQILLIGFFVGLILGTSTPDSVKSHFANSIKKEMETGKKVFHVGNIQFSPTKYKNLWLAEVKECNL